MWRHQKSEISSKAGKQSKAVKRLLKDLKAMRSNTIPTVGVSALPLNDDIFTWHCNIRGPKETNYEGGMFHLVLVFPKSYPFDPPDVTICTQIPHPNVFGSRVCLDMLEPGDEQDEYVGWSSAYSVESILIQLQSFFFETSASITRKQCRKAVEAAQKYHCTSCPHRPLRSWPPLPSIEDNSFVLHKTEKEIIREELVCYHSKRTLDEDTLGYGISFHRNIKTGGVENISSPIELVGIRAFMRGTSGSTAIYNRYDRGSADSSRTNTGIRKSSSNVPFSHWMPVYLDKEHGQRAMHLAKKALSMIKKGNTKNFEPEMVLDIFPKLMSTMIVNIMKGQIHHSIRALEGYCQFHRMFIAFLLEYPELHKKAQEMVRNFVENPEARHKDIVPSIGELLPLVSVTNYTWEDIAEAVVYESLDRGVFWVVKDYPQMAEEIHNPDVDKKRTDVFLAVNLVGYRLIMFHNFFLTRVVEPKASIEDMAAAYDELYGHPSNKVVEAMQNAFREIKKVETYNDYFSHVGCPIVGKEELVDLLLKSVKNSREKGYHGSSGPRVPTPEELAEESARKNVDLETLCIPADEGTSKGTKVLHSKEEEWKQLCENRWGITALPEDTISKDNSWKRLYLQNNLQDLTTALNARPDFTRFYSTITLSANWITCIELKIFNPNKLKSGYHFLTGLLGKLTSLERVNLTKGDGGLGLKGVKSLTKGLINNPNSIKYLDLSYSGITPDSTKILADGLLASSNLEYFNLQGNALYHQGAKELSRVLWEHKSLTDLNLSNCSINVSGAKDLADGLLANKKLKKVHLGRNPLTGEGLRAVIYNLAFSPSIEELDLSRIMLHGREDLSEALTKLLRISMTLKYLNLWQTKISSSLNRVTIDALSTNKSLEILDLGEIGTLSSTSLSALGKALAVNETLQHLNISNCGISDSGLETVYKGLLVEVEDKKVEDEKAKKDRKRREMMGDVEKVETEVSLHLKELNLSNNYLLGSGKGVGKLILMGQTLHTLNLENCSLSSMAGENIGLALESNKSLTKVLLRGNNLGKEGTKYLVAGLKNNNSVRMLDLSGNSIGVSGARALSDVLTVNKSIQELNLFGNLVDVDGARALAHALKSNESLTSLDIGVNRIRDKGAIAIATALKENKTLSSLSIKLNHINDTGILALANAISTSAVTHVSFAGNEFTDEILLQISEIFKGTNVSMDLENRLALLDPKRVQRSIWVTPLPKNTVKESIKRLFYENACGVVLNISLYDHKVEKSFGEAKYAFVEFGHKNSVEASLDLSSSGKAFVDGKRIQIYRVNGL